MYDWLYRTYIIHQSHDARSITTFTPSELPPSTQKNHLINNEVFEAFGIRFTVRTTPIQKVRANKNMHLHSASSVTSPPQNIQEIVRGISAQQRYRKQQRYGSTCKHPNVKKAQEVPGEIYP